MQGINMEERKRYWICTKTSGKVTDKSEMEWIGWKLPSLWKCSSKY